MAKKGQSSGISDKWWNRLSTAVLALTVLVSIYYVVVFASPSFSPFGPTEEPKLVTILFTSTPKPTIAITDTPVAPPPTWTPQPTPTPPPTYTPLPTRPTNTPRPTIFFTPLPTPTETPGTPTATRHPYPFKLVDDGINYTSYFFSADCNWLGIAGEVLDTEGEHLTGISVVLNGGGFQNRVTTSGQAPDYAPSGWEHFLDAQPKEGTFLIQLWNRGQPISEEVEVRTTKDCRKNLAYLVFEQVWEDYVP